MYKPQILLRGRDVGREHDRWTEPQVGPTDHPEFRSYFSGEYGSSIGPKFANG